MGYDPQAHGAACDKCPLAGLPVVPPEWGHACTKDALRNRTAVAVVGEAPGEQETRLRRPFVGRSGEELDKALHKAKIPRQAALVTNVLLCQPPKNELRELLDRIKRSNKELLAEHKKAVKLAISNSQPLPPEPTYTASPVDCCRPRLEKELEHFENFITLGKTATHAVTGVKASIGSVRGALLPREATALSPSRKVLPTVHPAFCLRNPRWFHVFHADIAKAGAWFRGEIDWHPPIVRWQPTPQQLREFIARHRGKALTSDLETDDIEPLTAKIRCVGIGNEHEVLVVSILSKEGDKTKRFYSRRDEDEIIAIFKAYYEDESQTKIGHNFGGYDKVVLQQQWGITVRNILDTVLLHRVVESELPHSLAYVVSMYTIAPAWKTDREGNKLSTDAESDQDLALYCAFDVCLNARVVPGLVKGAEEKQQVDVYLGDIRIQQVCADMHTVGMYVDQEVRQKTEVDILKRRQRVLADIRGFLGKPDFNPGSVLQLRDLLFDTWQLTPPLTDEERLTNKLDPSTSDLVLRALITDPALKDDPRRQLIKMVRIYRRLQKVLGTYVVKLRPWSMLAEGDLGWDEEEEDGEGWADAELRRRYGIAKRGIVNPYTGRMYPGYNAAVAVTGRLSSSKPINSQNFPSSLRSMVTAAPGHVLVGADMDQLELRIAAARWGVKLYLRAFAEGKDPHSMTAFAVFGEAFCRAAGVDPKMFEREGPLVGDAYEDGKFAKKEGEAYKMRTLSKMVQYACIGASEHVAVLGPESSKAIRDMRIGDWVWSWSKLRGRYEPAQVTEVMPRGTRQTVRVHFAWGRGQRWRSSMLVTTDHLCIMRDGTEREAGTLRPGDRLMPFRRSKPNPRGYRYMFPFNDDRRAGEHRVVMGFLDEGSGGTHVHHRNEQPADNRPENLEVMPEPAHVALHGGSLAEGRKQSALWRAAVSDPATRSAASTKAWVGRRTRKETDKAFAQRSRLAPWHDRMGHEPDASIAAEAGCTAEAVAYYRKSRGIAARVPSVGERGWFHRLCATDERWRQALQEDDLASVQLRIYDEYGVEVSLNLLRRVRARWQTTAKKRGCAWESVADILGHVPDRVVAERLNVSVSAVCAHRKKHGIPAYDGDQVDGTNHVVTKVEVVGPEEVWDIEVDHEDHNFGLAAGVFVHNSQYKATVETVAMLIRKTEVAARDEEGNERKDGTTELPYALLPLRRVREMHGNWLSGAPEFKTGWDKEIAHFKKHGFVQEYVTGRKRYFLDTAQSRDAHMSGTNEIVNFAIQSAAAGLMNKAILLLHEQIPLHKWGPGTGIINQCHDSIVIECPADGAHEVVDPKSGKKKMVVPPGSIPDRVAKLLEECLNQTDPSLPGVVFTATASVAHTWKDA